MMLRRLLILILSLCCVAASGQGVQYRSDLVRTLDAKASKMGSLGKRQVIREYDEQGTMTNVGLDVFGYDMSDMLPQDIASFIERYFLELLCWEETTIQQKMYDDKVVFTNGDPHDILKMDNTCDFNLGCRDNKEYTATWSKDGKVLLAFSFPIEFELILGMTQAEVELLLEGDIRRSGAPEVKQEEKFEQMPDGVYRSVPVENYYMNSLVNCRYYSKGILGEYTPLFTGKHISESAANLFQLAMDKDFDIEVKQSIYGFKKLDYQITASQWVAYCQKHGLTTYFAIEKEDENSIMALIISESKELAFNHMLSVVIPKSFIDGKKVSFKAKLNAYIPTHNISDLYQQYKKK